MDAYFTEDQVFQALCGELGQGRAARELTAGVAELFRAYDPKVMSLSMLTSILSERMYAHARRLFGPELLVLLPDNRTRRLDPAAMPDAADRVLLVLLDGMRVTPSNHGLLKDHMLATGSVSAMTVLYRRYAGYYSADELALMARILREQYPRGAEPDWLKGNG